jgi:hypothetical protein
MAFFRHTSETLQKLHAYPPFASLQAFLTSSLRADAEESQFSHYYFAKNDAFTYLHVEGMIDPPATILISDKGTFYLDLRKHEFTLQIRQKLLSIIAAAHAQSTSTSEGLAADGSYAFPSFTSTGIQKHSPVKTVGFRGWFWFPEEYVAYYEPGWVIGEREHKAYFMRDAERGPTAQRLEPRDRYLLDRGGLSVNEGLYKHFQAEKYFGKPRRVCG